MVTTDILNGFAERKLTLATFFDIEKAYDTIKTHTILAELKKLNIKGNLLNSIKDFLHNRHFRVRIGTTYSEKKYPKNGIPQGSVLSVNLFNVGINGILDELPSNVQGSLYADDLMIYTTTKTTRTATRTIQQGIDKVNQWLQKTGLNI